MSKRFGEALILGLFGLAMFASVIYDMELSVGGSQRCLVISIACIGLALYQLVRGLLERSGKDKLQDAPGSDR